MNDQLQARAALANVMLVAAALGGGLPSLGEPSSYAVRHDPRRPKTAEDLRNIEAARIRRDKREAKRNGRVGP